MVTKKILQVQEVQEGLQEGDRYTEHHPMQKNINFLNYSSTITISHLTAIIHYNMFVCVASSAV